MEKLFHPTIEGSKLCALGPEELDVVCMLLHAIGWFTQQGVEEEAIGFLRQLIQMDRQLVVRACAGGIADLLGSNPQKA